MQEGTLRQLADARGLLIGSCYSVPGFEQDAEYGQILAAEMNVLVAENILKPRLLQPDRGVFDFAAADRMVAFAEANGMKVRGHTLTWHAANPEWLVKGEFTRSQALDLLKEHIFSVVGHFKGKVFAWDVINELIGDTAILRAENPWVRFIGPDYVDYVFQWAHEADPDCLLFYNDYAMDVVCVKSDRCRRWLGGLLERGVPIHGVGLQAHLWTNDDEKSLATMPENIRLFNEMGLTVHITELDVNAPADATEADLERQAEVYRLVFEAAVQAKDCPAVLLWGFTDRHSWIRDFHKGKRDHALIFDREYARKPAYEAIRKVLAG